MRMAEPESTTSTIKPEKKTLPLDDEIGKDFLGSWNLLSVTKDDTMDFNFETVSKGKKKAFNFDKLDMDFSLDAGFDKISSLKADMQDLDFCSPKVTGKSRDGSDECMNVNRQKKKDCFFSFDFSELDSFSLDSSLLKGEKICNKNVDGNEVDSTSKKECRSFGTQPGEIESIKEIEDSVIVKTPAAATLTNSTSKVESLILGLGDTDSTNNMHPSIQACTLPDSKKVSPEKTVTPISQGLKEQSRSSERIIQTETFVQQNIQDLLFQSAVSGNDSTQETVSRAQGAGFFLEAKVTTSPVGEQNVEMIAVSDSVSEDLKKSSPVHVTGSPSKSSDRERMGANDRDQRENRNEVELGQEDMDLESTLMTSTLLKTPQDTKVNKDTESSTPRLPLASLSRPPTDSLMLTKQKEIGSIRLNMMKKSDDTNSKSHQASAQLKLLSLGGKRLHSKSSILADDGRESADATAKHRSSSKCTSTPDDRGLTKVGALSLDCEINAKELSTSRAQVHPSGFRQETPISANQKGVNIPPIHLSRLNNVEESKLSPLKAFKRTPDLSSLKMSRTIRSNNDKPNPTCLKENKSSTILERTMEAQVKEQPKITQSVGTERKTPLLPSLKRKTFETNVDPTTLQPLKRLSESPTDSRTTGVSFEGPRAGQICNNEGHVGKPEDVSDDSSTTTHDFPGKTNIAELEIPLVMKKDENVEKAEACTKELENICNMLRKKREEAKEILVRAIVNNNNLLMLNHPMYDAKIQMIQKYALQNDVN